MLKRAVILGVAVAVTVAVSLHADQVLTGLGGGGGGVLLQPNAAISATTQQSGVANVLTIASQVFAPTTTGWYGCAGSGQGCNTNILFKGANSGGPFTFDVVTGLSANATFMDFKLAGSSSFGLGNRQYKVAGGVTDAQCQAGGGGCVSSGGALNLISTTGQLVADTGGFIIASGPLFKINNNAVQKFAVDFAGTLTTAVPIPQASGGTGAGSLNCAGQVLTSNGTAYSCTTPAGNVVASGQVNADGTIAVQYGAAVTAGTHASTGLYVVNINGMTATTGVVMVTPIMPGAAAGRHASALPGLNSFQVQLKSGADGLIDDRFMFTVEHL